MRSYVNPFRARTSEQLAHQGLDRYLRTFGADALDLLPDTLWDRLVVIRSAPGGGKTSLLRAVAADALVTVSRRPDQYPDLVERLRAMGAVDAGARPLVAGLRVPLSRDFRGIVDLEPDPAAARRQFLRLLDARIVASLCAAAAVIAGADPLAADAEIEQPDTGAAAALARLGGPSVARMAEWAAQVENEVLDRLDAVLPTAHSVDGHGALHSLRALSGARIRAAGVASEPRPLLLLDDGHELERGQRRVLLDALNDRELDFPRWYTERYSAMEADEVVGDGEPARNHARVDLEREAMRLGASTRRGTKTRRFSKLLADISTRRAERALRMYDDEERSFVDLLDAWEGDEIAERADRATAAIRAELERQAQDDRRYRQWFADADRLEGVDAARRWRELQILIARDVDRREIGLFDIELTDEELRARSDSAIREAADLFLRREFGLPFYAGSQRVAKLAAENIEQYINLSGDLFDEMLVQITVRRGAVLSPIRQDLALRAAAEQFWRDIPARRIGGRGIQQLLRHIAHLARADTYRDKAPYAPGVSGTALSMSDRRRLLDPHVRARLPGAQELYEALHGAIGHNLLRARVDQSVKNDRWMVLYLNRLLCVRYGLPLGYGGFRERPLEEMCRWMLQDVEDAAEPPVQEMFELV